MDTQAIILHVQKGHTSDRYAEYVRVREESARQYKGFEGLGEDTWLIHLPEGLPFLGRLVSVCEHASLSYRCLSIGHKAVWIDYTPSSSRGFQ